MATSIKLGKLEQITDLRSIWKDEARDFTPWLAKEENLSLLSDAIGISIVLEETESSVGDFNVDLYAREEGTERKIIIENQLEATDHDHLGKIITYASGKEAEIIIWIVKNARDEHRQAIEWLNQHTDETFAFFLIEIEVWSIEGSLPAPKFNIVEQPNDWAKMMKRTSVSKGSIMYMDFWQEFNNYANNNASFTKAFKLRRPKAQHWYDLGVGSSAYHLCMTISSQKSVLTSGIYIDNDKNIYKKYKDYAIEIEQAIGLKVEWINDEKKKASRFLVKKDFDINNRESWSDGIEWLYTMCLKIKNIVSMYGI